MRPCSVPVNGSLFVFHYSSIAVLAQLDSATDGQPLTLEFYRAPTSDAEFSVQLWQLRGSGEGTKPRRVSPEVVAAEIHPRADPNGRLTFVIPAIRTAACDRLGLIITRLDAEEASDPLGEYAVELRLGGGA